MLTPPVDLEEKRKRAFPKARRQANDARTDQVTETKTSVATKIANLMLAAAVETWHDPAGEPYATFEADGIHKHYAIQSNDFEKLVRRLNYMKYGSAPAQEAVKAAINTVAGAAEFAGPEYPVYSRVAHYDGELYIDLGDLHWPAIRIIPASKVPDGNQWLPSWSVIPSDQVPVKFRRITSTKALHLPEPGGSLDMIRRMFPNIDAADWVLLQGFIIGCFQRTGGRAHLELQGGQGSGKSTLQRFLVSIIDPSEIPSRSVPRDEEATLISVQGRAMLAYDNVSVLSSDMADVWCRLSTGGGIGKRKLHTDQEEILLRAQLPISWTCITPIAIARPDLQDRTISLHLEALEETSYLSEEEVEDAAEEFRPMILGAICDALSVALARSGGLHLDHLPRMADFALWVEAASPALGWQEGAFVDVLNDARALASAMAVDASSVGILLRAFMRTRTEWSGSASILLEELKRIAPEDVRKSRNFPKDPTRLGRQLRRLQRPLGAEGISVAFNRSRASRDVLLRRNDASSGVLNAHEGTRDG